jgi:hypothetical protein
MFKHNSRFRFLLEFVCSIFRFLFCILYTIVVPFVLVFSVIALPVVLRFTASNDFLGIFMCIRCKTLERLGQPRFYPSFKPHRHTIYILRHFTNNFYIIMIFKCFISLTDTRRGRNTTRFPNPNR